MMIHGAHDFSNVRGGIYTKCPKLNENQIEILRLKKLCLFDLCYNCGSKFHKAGNKECTRKFFDMRNCPELDN